MSELLDFYKGKRVLITGHTGFKGSWMCEVLLNAGADVVGYALEPPTDPNLFELLGLHQNMVSVRGDVRNLEDLMVCVQTYQPEIVIHMAAQPIVRTSYESPVYTYETNVMGTVNILECIRKTDSVKSFVNVTTDKVYQNQEWCWGYRENDRLDGFDPYSNSKSCSELVTHSYQRSFLENRGVSVSTVRAGNVIGGGDFAKDRIIPDCVRAAQAHQKMIVRNPHSIRPYQHVLETVFGYLLVAQEQYKNSKFAGEYNIGPAEDDCITTGELVTLFCDKLHNGLEWINIGENGPHEANFLKLDCSKIKRVLHWHPVWDIEYAVEKTVEWTQAYFNHDNINHVVDEQIAEYCRT
jgi:CDP-glucose 4,6-dehydratase